MSGSKVVRYKRRPRAVAFIFALVLIYIICFVVLYISKSKVQTYEVNTGSLTNNAVYLSLIHILDRISIKYVKEFMLKAKERGKI